MKTLFAIQTESGQLWVDIAAHLDAKDAEKAAAIAAKDAEIAAKQIEIETLKGNPPPPPPKVIGSISKLAIRRKLRELSMEELLDAFLASSETVSNDWNDAQCLFLTDPLLAGCIPEFAAAAQITEAEIIQLLESCAE